MAQCYNCKAVLNLPGKPSRNEECPSCRRDIRVCLNCRHYDSSAYRSCRESISDEVRDKDRGNFCDWFQFKPDASGSATSTGTSKGKKAFDSLFGDD